MMRRSQTGWGFTLIELLVVVGIIALLSSVLLTAVSVAGRKAREARARREVHELLTAWKQYLNDYRTPPIGITQMNSNAVAILRGDTTNQNPFLFKYMDFLPNTVYYCDPWGRPNSTVGVYQVRFAPTDGTSIQDPFRPTNYVYASILVWSRGANPKIPEMAIRSWQY
jgi:prepilin-type N-terminal cleavage/methylation domain-containing protein